MAHMQWRRGWVGALVVATALPVGVALGKQPGRKFGTRPSERAADPYRPLSQRDYERLASRVEATSQQAADETGIQLIEGEDPAGELPPLDAAELRNRLPAVVGSLKRASIKGQGDEDTLPVVGHYLNPERTQMIRITLCDIDGGVPGVSAEDIERARSTTFNQQSADGYVRTTKIAGFKAIERLHRPTQTGEITLIAGERVGVHVVGKGVPMSTVQSAATSLNLPALAAIGR